ncbi:uncharacterized protein LOC143981498 [Lithobates pipiens]
MTTVSGVYGNMRKEPEIFTRPGSDLLIPIRIHLTLNHTDTERCDQIYWDYNDPTGHYYITIQQHWGCTLRKSDNVPSPNTRLSENGSLIISNVTPENDGIYSVDIWNSAGDLIQRDYYTVHVEVPVSVPLLHVSCLRNGSAEISCRVEEGTKPNIRLSVIGGSQERYSTSTNNITAIVGSPGPWNITCTVENGVSRSEESRAGVTCPVPLSDITVTFSCLPDGSAEAECSVKGSDPRYSWSLDGRSVSSHRRVTLPPPVSGTLHCDVTNQINTLSRSINISCADKPCLSCLWKSIIGGFLVLLVTMPPIFIAHWYLLRGIRRNLRPSTHKTRRNNPSSMMRQSRRTSRNLHA